LLGGWQNFRILQMVFESADDMCSIDFACCSGPPNDFAFKNPTPFPGAELEIKSGAGQK
jgi:hypothetical protein